MSNEELLKLVKRYLTFAFWRNIFSFGLRPANPVIRELYKHLMTIPKEELGVDFNATTFRSKLTPNNLAILDAAPITRRSGNILSIIRWIFGIETRKALAESQETNRRLDSELLQAALEKTELAAQLSQEKETVSSLRTELLGQASTIGRLESSLAVVKVREDSLSAREQALVDASGKVTLLRAKVTEQEDTIVKMTSALATAKEERIILSLKEEDLEAALADVASLKAEVEEQVDLKGKAQTAEAKTGKAKREVSTHAEQVTRLKGELAQAEVNIRFLKNALKDAQTEFRDKAQAAEARARHAERAQGLAKKEAGGLQATVEKDAATIKELEAEIATIRADRITQAERAESSARSLKLAEQSLAQLQSQMSQAEETIRHFETTSADEKAVVRTRAEAAEAHATELEQALMAAKEEISQLKAQASSTQAAALIIDTPAASVQQHTRVPIEDTAERIRTNPWMVKTSVIDSETIIEEEGIDLLQDMLRAIDSASLSDTLTEQESHQTKFILGFVPEDGNKEEINPEVDSISFSYSLDDVLHLSLEMNKANGRYNALYKTLQSWLTANDLEGQILYLEDNSVESFEVDLPLSEVNKFQSFIDALKELRMLPKAVEDAASKIIQAIELRNSRQAARSHLRAAESSPMSSSEGAVGPQSFAQRLAELHLTIPPTEMERPNPWVVKTWSHLLGEFTEEDRSFDEMLRAIDRTQASSELTEQKSDPEIFNSMLIPASYALSSEEDTETDPRDPDLKLIAIGFGYSPSDDGTITIIIYFNSVNDEHGNLVTGYVKLLSDLELVDVDDAYEVDSSDTDIPEEMETQIPLSEVSNFRKVIEYLNDQGMIPAAAVDAASKIIEAIERRNAQKLAESQAGAATSASESAPRSGAHGGGFFKPAEAEREDSVTSPKPPESSP